VRTTISGRPPVPLATSEGSQSLTVGLRKGLDEGEFFLVYQPVFDLSTGSVVGAEALLRWLRPAHGVVHPDDFIPTLESSGLIVPVGRWVLNEACHQGANWWQRGHRMPMAVNLSTRQLQDGRILEDIKGALDESGLDPGSLVLELSEISLMQQGPPVVGQLQILKALGARIAIDDFGAGYNSFSYLQQLPVDILKIDESLVARMTTNFGAAAAVDSVAHLGRTIGLRTVAEGIETDEQKLLLQAAGIDYGQGILLAPPLDVREVDCLLDISIRDAEG
jgi:EAL domain-containing protein (putative c-di-GMP-specific phosphodiesterase class I)